MKQKKNPTKVVGDDIIKANKLQYKDTKSVGFEQIIHVGNDYFEEIKEPDIKTGRLKTSFEHRTKDNIISRFGKYWLSEIPYYDKFVNVPAHHEDYRQTFDNGGNGCYNRYHKLEYEPLEGEIESTKKLIKHIFQDKEEIGWDYLTLLYRKPTQVLPVVCLVSKANNTGKSTFLNFLTYLFGENATPLNEDHLSNSFNFWVTSLLAIFEEIGDGKKNMDRIKEISTAKQTTLNEKNRPQRRIDSYVKLILLSNNSEGFIKANENDIRYLILELPSLTDLDPDFEDKLKAEIPSVAFHLAHRELTHPKKSRMWFEPSLIKTEALQKVVENSRSDCAKDIEVWAQDQCSRYGEVCISITDLMNELKKYPMNTIRKALQEDLKMNPSKGRYRDKYGNEINGQHYTFSPQTGEDNLANCDDDKLPF